MFAQTPASHIRATKNGGGKHKCLSVFSHALLFPSPYARGNCTHNDKKEFGDLANKFMENIFSMNSS